MFVFRQRENGSIGTLVAIAPGEVPPPASPDTHEFCVNIASAVQLTTRHHHLRHSQVVAWFEAMDHTCMRNAQMFGSGPIESSIVVDNHEYKKPQMTYVFCTYVF